jgi:hypothetical protein
MGPAAIAASSDFVIIAWTRQNPLLHSLECCAPFAMTSPMHAPAGADGETEAAPTNLPLASCGFARHANIARVCGTPYGLSGSSGPSARNFAMTCRRKPLWALCRVCYVLSVSISVDTGQQVFTEGKNRRRSMPESSLTEEAAIPRPVMSSPLASRPVTPAGLTSPEFRTCIRSRNCSSGEIYQRSSATAGRSSPVLEAGVIHRRTAPGRPCSSAISHHHASKLLSRKVD